MEVLAVFNQAADQEGSLHHLSRDQTIELSHHYFSFS
jgi:hypothetical protein